MLLLLAVPTVQAQEHRHDHTGDTTRAMMPDSMMMQMETMMQMHERMMADSALFHAMMADSSLMARMAPMMQEMMGGEGDRSAMFERMSGMPPASRRQLMAGMHERMRERMQTATPEERRQLMARMQEVHQRMMENPAVRAHMQADPEMRRMMEQMMEGDMMDHGQMDHGQMDHGQMDHGQMDHGQMDHGQMDHGQMDHGQPGPAPMSAGEARDAEAASRTADRFREALAAGDRAAVEALLLPDAVILEGGRSEARAEYLGHHFGRDAAFLAAVERTPVQRRTTVAADAAWVASTSRLTGTYEDRPVDLDSAELLVLRRDPAAPDGWRVAAIHWSSSARN